MVSAHVFCFRRAYMAAARVLFLLVVLCVVGDLRAQQMRSGFVTEDSEDVDEPADQDAPLLGKEEIPFWHDTRLSTAGQFFSNMGDAGQTIPAGYGMLFGYEAPPADPWYPELRTELGLLNFASEPNSVLGLNWALGFIWLVPLKGFAAGAPGAIQFALLPGAAWVRIQDRIEAVTALKFQFQGVLGYEIELQPRLVAFVQGRYSYLYDPAVPFHSVGVAAGVSYHFMAQLRKSTRR